MKNNRLLLILTIIFLSVDLNAEPMPESREMLGWLDANVLDFLEQNQQVYRYDDEFSGIRYYPALAGGDRIEKINQSLDPEVMVEALYKLPYPEGFEVDSQAILDIVYKLSHQVSSISGVKYYSVRKQDYEVLFTDVYAVNNLDEHKKVGDPMPSDYSPVESVFLHMKENALGSGYYRIENRRYENSLSIEITNETDLGFIISAVSSEDMIIYLEIFPCSDSILIYGYCGVVLQNDPIVHLMLDPYFAFYRRMTAMETWLYNSLHGTDMLPPIIEPMP